MAFNGNGNLTGSAQYFNDKPFYNGVATQSLRFAYTSAETWLARTPNAGNRKTHTLSVWVKRSGLSASQNILEARGSGDTGNVDIWFDANDRLEVSGSSTYWRTTTRKFRDVSSWYHIMIVTDTTDGTAADRLKIYVNGTRETSFVDNNHYSQNTDYAIGGNVEHRIGDGYGHFDGYMARYEFVDGIALDASYFGETKNDVWIPKKYTGSYGTNGHLLEFKETGTDADANGLGADTSTNNNHYTPTAILGPDSNMPDSPENNFCTWNPLSNTGVTLSEGNLQTSGGASHVCGGTMAVTSGKWYWECKLKSTVNGSNPVILGFVSANTIAHANNFEQGVYFYTDNEGNKNIVHVENNSATQTITVPSAMLPIAVDEVMQYAYDGDTGKIWFGIENVWADNSGGTTGNPSTGANPTFTLADTSIFMTPLRDHGGVAWTGLANFGQLDNDYTAPTGFNSLSTSNLPEPLIGANSDTQADDYFNTVLYTGNGSTQSITGVGFKPDWVWIKGRSFGSNNRVTDSSRGASKGLKINGTDAEDTSSTYYATAFGSDGFSLNSGAGDVNQNNETFVAWNWKANGGTTSSNTDGSTTSTVQANTTAGFSIVTYAGNSASKTVGHGLDSAPEWVIVKSRTDAERWAVFHTSISNQYIYLNETFAGETSNADERFGDSSSVVVPNSTVVTLGANNSDVNENGDNYIMYCFHSVEGYSKFGSYTGSGDTDGTFVFTGFRPAWLMIKRYDSTNNWHLWDTTRGTFNPMGSGSILLADDVYYESQLGSVLDILSNGFKPRANSSGYNNGSYIYMAFAEAPFKYANAR